MWCWNKRALCWGGALLVAACGFMPQSSTLPAWLGQLDVDSAAYSALPDAIRRQQRNAALPTLSDAPQWLLTLEDSGWRQEDLRPPQALLDPRYRIELVYWARFRLDRQRANKQWETVLPTFLLQLERHYEGHDSLYRERIQETHKDDLVAAMATTVLQHLALVVDID